MSIQKKSLISTLKATKKANVAKEDLPGSGVASQDPKDLQASRRLMQARRADLQAGRVHVQAGKANLQAGKASLQGGKARLQAGKARF